MCHPFVQVRRLSARFVLQALQHWGSLWATRREPADEGEHHAGGTGEPEAGRAGTVPYRRWTFLRVTCAVPPKNTL